MAPREAEVTLTANASPSPTLSNKASGTASSLPGLWKTPSYWEADGDGPVTGDSYLAYRRHDDGAEGLWRVHDKLYDLSGYIKQHPGGEHWLQTTRGMDVTELFESHHFSKRATDTLARYYTRDATQRRNSPYTFHEDGFYRTLKRRALPVLAATPDSDLAPRFNDALVAGAFVAMAVAGHQGSYLAATIGALLVTFATNCAHNFTHGKNNWRMYYKSLCFMSLSDWRVSHIISHHMYPNTLLDLDISMHEPMLRLLPKDKSLLYRVACVPIFICYAASNFLVALCGRLSRMQPADFLPLLFLAPLLAGGASLGQALCMWTYLGLAHSLFYNVVGITAGHHHPDIFHDGDAPREDRDWGLGQLDAVRDRAEHGDSSFLVLMFFGDHALHHLFPTVDHCRLPALYPVLRETLSEFGIEYHFTSSWELVKGAFWQLVRTQPNAKAPGSVIALGEELHGRLRAK